MRIRTSEYITACVNIIIENSYIASYIQWLPNLYTIYLMLARLFLRDIFWNVSRYINTLT